MVELIWMGYIFYGLYFVGKNLDDVDIGSNEDGSDLIAKSIVVFFAVIFWPLFKGTLQRDTNKKGE